MFTFALYTYHSEFVTILIAAKAEKNKTKECGISPKKENGKNRLYSRNSWNDSCKI